MVCTGIDPTILLFKSIVQFIQMSLFRLDHAVGEILCLQLNEFADRITDADQAFYSAFRSCR